MRLDEILDEVERDEPTLYFIHTWYFILYTLFFILYTSCSMLGEILDEVEGDEPTPVGQQTHVAARVERHAPI